MFYKLKNFVNTIYHKDGIIPSILLDIFLIASVPLLYFFEKFYFHFFVWIMYVPGIFLTYKKSLKVFLCYSLIYIFFDCFLSVYYIFFFSQKFFLIALFYTFFSVYIFNLLLYFFYKKISYPTIIFIFPTLYFVFYILTNFINGGGLWFNISIWQPMLYPLPWLLGVDGVGFLILLFNSLVAFYILKKEKRILYTIIIFIVFLSSCFLYSYLAIPTGTKIKVALIQGNFQKDWGWRIANANSEIFNTYNQLSREAAKAKPDIIIWPEYAIPEDIFTNKELYDKISQLAKDTNAYLVFGAVGKTDLTDPEFNYIKDMAYVFSRKGDYIGGYTSVIPFPFNEKVIAGTDFPVFNTDIGTFGISTCYEENYDFIDKLYAEKGADFIISLANNEPLTVLREFEVQALHARFNAAEIKKYIIRASNTGITEVINPYGKVEAKLEPKKSGYLIADIYIKK
jgi:apolipoprotein N-acyltransferase